MIELFVYVINYMNNLFVRMIDMICRDFYVLFIIN